MTSNNVGVVKKLRIFLIILLFIVPLFPHDFNNSASAQVFTEKREYPTEEFIKKDKPVSAELDDFRVSWYLIQEMPYIFNITIENLNNVERIIELETLFYDLDLDRLENLGFYEWVNVSHAIVVKDYIWKVNKTGSNIRVSSGEHVEYKYWYEWVIRKVQSSNRKSDEYQENLGEIIIGKSEIKTFQLRFSTSMGFLTFGRIAIKLGDTLFDPWFNTSWSFRKNHTINGVASAQTNYQVNVTVEFGSGTDSGNTVYLGGEGQTDFEDIRFTASDTTTLLDYWIESKTDSVNATVWIEVDTIPQTPSTVLIHIYYGNAEASSASNGPNTFPSLFDHFDDSSLNTTIWDQVDSPGTTVESGTILTLTASGSADYENVASDVNFSVPIVLRFRAQFDTAMPNPNSHSIVQFGTTQGETGVNDMNRMQTISDSETQTIIAGDGSSSTSETPTFTKGSLANYEIRRNGTNTLFYENTTFISNIAKDLNGARYVAFMSNIDGIIILDWVLLRKYIVSEPTHGAWGPEQVGVPDAPTLVLPATGTDALLGASVVFTWTFNGQGADNQTAYQFQLINSTESIVNDTGKTTSANPNTTIIVPEIAGSYNWRVRTWGDLNIVSEYSTNNTLEINSVFTESVTITNIEAGNYIFASTVYLFEAVYQGGNDTFRVAFDDGITFINMSYDRTDLSFQLDSGSTIANLLSVTFSETGNTQTVTFRVFLLETINDILDRDIHMWVNTTLGAVDGWDEKRTDFLNIYNQGGLTESSTTGGGFLVAGGNIFAMAVQSNVTSDFVRLNVTWRKFQHVSFKVSVFQNSSWDAGNNHFDCISEHTNTADIEYGVDYAVSGSFIEGWNVKIFVVDGDAGNAGNDRAWARLNVTWYNRGSSVKSDLIYTFYEAHNADDGNTQFSLWVDLWVDIMEGSSRVGGRVSPVFFGMREEGWGPWASWGPMPNSTTVSLYSDDLLDASSLVLASSQIGLFNVWASLNKTDGGVATPSCNTHQWSLGDYDIFGWSTLGVTQPMIGIDTPTPNLPRTPDIGAPGLFSSITLAISLMTKQIVNALLQGATVTSFAIASIIDSAFAFFGIDNFIGLMTSALTSLGARFSLAITNVTTIIITVYTFIASSVTWFGLTLTGFVSFWVNLASIMSNIMDGTYGGQGVNWWTLLNWSELFSSGFVPLFITLTWFSTVDSRAKQQGGNWINILWGDTTILLGMTSFFIDMFFTLINFVISSVFNIMNALDIAARRVFGA